MFVVFGWLKEQRRTNGVVKCHCYRCQRMRGWEHWKETEWVTFFAIKTIPFMSKSYLVCSACREPRELQAVVASMLAKPTDLSALQMKLEEQQLASKSDVQRAYLLSQREQLTARRDDAA